MSTKYKALNRFDGNDEMDIEGNDIETAAINALNNLGWSIVVNVDVDKGHDEEPGSKENMKILVATKEKQGVRKNDFCFANEGEIVRFSMECDGENIDGSCGCRRSLCGLDTSKATTTMKVIDTKMTHKEFESLYLEALKKDGWVSKYDIDKGKLWAKRGVEDILKITNGFKHGDIIEKRGDEFNIR